MSGSIDSSIDSSWLNTPPFILAGGGICICPGDSETVDGGLKKFPESWGAEISGIGFAASVQPVGNLTMAEGRPRHRLLPGLEIPVICA